MITYKGMVYPHQLDHMDHMNVQWYVAKFDEGTWNLFARLGLTPEYMRENRRGMAAVEQTLRYHAEVLAGDLLAIDSAVVELTGKTIRIRHRMRDTIRDRDVATCDLVAVHLNREIRRSALLPDFVSDAARAIGWADHGEG